jgi:hypothetical protein
MMPNRSRSLFNPRVREWIRNLTGVQLSERDEGDRSGADRGDDEEEVSTQPVREHHHLFSDLSRHAKKYYKLQQRKSIPAIENFESDGVCLGLALMWIEEKLSTTNSYFQKMGSAKKNFITSKDDDIHSYNRDHIMVPANGYQRLVSDGRDMSPIEIVLKLVKFEHERQHPVRTAGGSSASGVSIR